MAVSLCSDGTQSSKLYFFLHIVYSAKTFLHESDPTRVLGVNLVLHAGFLPSKAVSSLGEICDINFKDVNFYLTISFSHVVLKSVMCGCRANQGRKRHCDYGSSTMGELFFSSWKCITTMPL